MNKVYILEYDGSSFHKNYLELDNGLVVTDYPLNSAGYVPLAAVTSGTALEAMLQVMVASFCEMEVRPTLDSVRRVVDRCFELSARNERII